MLKVDIGGGSNFIDYRSKSPSVGNLRKMHESLHVQQASRSRRARYEKGEATCCSGEASPPSNVTLVWFLPSLTQGENNRRVEMTKVVLLYRTDLSHSVKTHPRCIRI